MVSRGIWESHGESGGSGSGGPALPPAGVHGSHTTELLHGSGKPLVSLSFRVPVGQAGITI